MKYLLVRMKIYLENLSGAIYALVLSTADFLANSSARQDNAQGLARNDRCSWNKKKNGPVENQISILMLGLITSD